MCEVSKTTTALLDSFNMCPANICMFQGNSRNTRKRCEIGLKLIIKTPERHC